MTVSYIVTLQDKTSRDYLQSLRSYEISSSNTTWINQSHAKTQKRHPPEQGTSEMSSMASMAWQWLRREELLNLMKVDVAKDMMWWLMTVDRISLFLLGGWRDTRWIFILVKSEICNSTKSTAKRSRDCNSTPPPSYGSYPNCPNRSRWTAGWCSGFVAFLSFPCKQDSTTNFKKHPNPDYTGQAMVGKNDSAIAGRSWSFPNRMCWDWWRFWRLHE